MTVVAYHEENHLNPYRTSLRGPLAEILALSPGKRVAAEPNDAPGCTAEFVVGSGWCGHLGSLSTVVGIPTGNLVSGRVTTMILGITYLFNSGSWVAGASIDGSGNVEFPGSVSAKSFLVSGEYDFIPVYSAGVPQTAALQIVAGQSQSVAIPAGATAIRLTFRGFGPFAYRLGASNVAAVLTDAPGPVDQTVVVPVTGTHIAVWGIGAGSLVVEAGTYLPKTGFVPVYSSGAPKVASLAVAAGISQRVALPTDCTAFRLTFRDYGPFAYRLGDSNVTAVTTDSPGDVLSPVVIPLVPGATYIAVYGIGAGSLVVEGGLKA